MSDDNKTLALEHEAPSTGNKKRLEVRKDDLFGHDPGARPLQIDRFVGPLAERAPDGSILITEAGSRWFFNELAPQLAEIFGSPPTEAKP